MLTATVRATVGTLSFGAVVSAAAAVPGGAVLALGWMLEAEGRAATGRRDAVAGTNFAARPPLGRLLRASAALAGAAAVLWLAVQPVRLLAGVASDAAVIAPRSGAAETWRILTLVLAAAVAVHLCLWLLAGGRTGWFRPVRNLLRVARDPGGAADRLGARAAWLWAEFAPVRSLWLGVRGWLVAAAWLAVPSGLLAVQGERPVHGLLRVLGGLWLVVVLPLVPAAQANLAAARNAGGRVSLKAGLNPRAAWRTYRARPARWVGTLLIVLAGSIGLYLVAVVEMPADAAWLVTPVCVAAVLPGRLLAGACRRNLPEPAARWSRRWWWACGWLPVGWGLSAAYAGLLFLTPYVTADGPAAVLKQAGSFAPVPF